ncbi:MAG: hypothetical protein ACKO6G_08675, partial [Vulcanococcus sp.]
MNDAPSGADRTITTLEDTAYSFTAADFGFSDPADAAGAAGANSLQSVIISSLPGTGSLLLAGSAVSAGQEIAAASLTSLSYTPKANASGGAVASISFQVRDNGGNAGGGVDLDPTPNTININIKSIYSPVNYTATPAEGQAQGGSYNYFDDTGSQLTDDILGYYDWTANLGNGQAYEWVGWRLVD